MRLHQSRARRPRRRAGGVACPRSFRAEPLESRRLLNATVVSGIDAQELAPGTGAINIDLTPHFSDPTVTGTAVVISTNVGDIPINLLNKQEPNTVANFLQYVTAKSYDDTVIQRAVPGFLLQGGGFLANQTHITTNAAIQNEFTGISNTTGTIAAALKTDPSTQQVDINSATSDWFINDGNNTSLDAQKFTVFGQVLYNGMTVVNNIEALPKSFVAPSFEPNVNAGDPPGGVLPLQGYNEGSPIHDTNYVYANTIAQVNPLLFTVTSDNTGIASAAVNGTTLSITPGSTNGIAHITVTATDLGGNQVQTAFDVQVGQTQAVLGNGQSKLVKFTDPDGTAGQITYSGPGTATVSFGGLGLSTTPGKGGIVTIGGTPNGITVAVTGATAASSLTITGKGGNGMVDLAGITSDGPMRAINGRNTSVEGDIVSAGGIGSAILAQVVGGNVKFLAGAVGTFSVGTMTNSGLFTTGPVKSIVTNTWTGGAINVTDIGKLTAKGAFQTLVTATSIQSVSAGSIGAGNWGVTGNLGAITAGSIAGWNATVGSLGNLVVKTTLDSSNVLSTGNINSLNVAALSSSEVFAGVSSALLPSQASDIAATSIKTVKVKILTQSSVAGGNLGSVNLGVAQAPTGPSPFGAAAHQIKSLLVVIDGKLVKITNASNQAQVTAAYTAAGVTSTEPEIRVV
jgi:cyclophilin family peptidyl-prolyl cis-trans isomerase